LSDAVKSRRRYDRTGRQEQARRNRWAVLEAARRLFLERGYAATTVAAIAAEAGVSAETVYKAFGNKPGLVKAVFDVAIAGDDEPVPLVEREMVRRIEEATDPRQKLAIYGEHLAATLPRHVPVQLVVRAAAASDGGAAQAWAELQAERLRGMDLFAAHLAASGCLRAGVSQGEARDVLWAHTSTELYELLVLARGWDVDRYTLWVVAQLEAALLA